MFCNPRIVAGLAGAVKPDAADRSQEADRRAAAAQPSLAHGRIRQASQVSLQVRRPTICVKVAGHAIGDRCICLHEY